MVVHVLPDAVETDRLLLRTWLEEDADALDEIVRLPGYLEHMPPSSGAEQVAAWRERWATDGFAPWAACERASGRLIGRIGLMRHHDWPLAAEPVEVGWALHDDWWGKGLATEGGRASIDVWRRFLPDERLYSFAVPCNRRSRAVMERLGMTYGGTTVWRGREHLWYSLDRGTSDG